jgi:general stress protein 26
LDGRLDRWFKQGIDAPRLVLIKVRGERAHHWDAEGEGEFLPERGALVGGP